MTEGTDPAADAPAEANGRPLFQSEAPVRVFISSAMDDETRPYREAVAVAAGSADSFIPWLFEFTPAAPGDVREGYLASARNCDILAWLVGSRTTQPVVDEIGEAVRAGRPVLVFRVERAEPDEAGQRLLQSLRGDSKYAVIADPTDFVHNLKASASDFLIREYRQKGTSRARLLEGMRNRNLQWIAERWIAAGVPTERASVLAGDPTIGAPAGVHSPSEARPFIVISSEVGSGKSLLAGRLFAGFLERAANNPRSPIPVLVEGATLMRSLEEYVEPRAKELGDPSELGVALIVDGADESPLGVHEIIGQARLLSARWPNSQIVVTSRPVEDIDKHPGYTTMAPMDDEQTARVVAAVLGEDVRSGYLYGWPVSLREAVKRPLFAVLYAVSRARSDYQAPQSKADLIQSIVSQALSRRPSVQHAERVLRALAREGLRRNAHLLPAGQVARADELEALRTTGLIAWRGPLVGFALAVFQEWFGARSLLADNDPTPQTLAADSALLASWEPALALAVAAGTPGDAARILCPIAATRPAVAARIVDDAVPHWGLDDIVPAAPAKDCGAQILESTKAWAEGLGPLARLVAPLERDGGMKPVGTWVSGSMLLVAWYPGEDHPDDIMDIQPGAAPFGPGLRPGTSSFRPGPSPGWSWRWTRDYLRRRLDGWLKDRALLPAEILQHEYAWGLAQEVHGVGGFYSEPIPLDELERQLNHVWRTLGGRGRTASIQFRLRRRSTAELKALERRIRELRSAGSETIAPPYIPPDRDPKKGGYVWSRYSPRATVAHMIRTHEMALGAYNSIVREWFPRFASDLHMSVLQPLRFVGRVQPAGGEDDRAGMDYYVLPLPRDSPNVVDIREGRRPRDIAGQAAWEEIMTAFEQHRPELRSRASMGSMVLPLPTPRPVTNLAYRWLREDLKSVGWAADASSWFSD